MEIPGDELTYPVAEGDVLRLDSSRHVLGAMVFFVTRYDTFPGVVVACDNNTGKLRLQTFNKKSDGCQLSPWVDHISSGEMPCWAVRHEIPVGGIHSPHPSGHAETRD